MRSVRLEYYLMRGNGITLSKISSLRKFIKQYNSLVHLLSITVPALLLHARELPCNSSFRSRPRTNLYLRRLEQRTPQPCQSSTHCVSATIPQIPTSTRLHIYRTTTDLGYYTIYSRATRQTIRRKESQCLDSTHSN